jgi:hypothetical protein
MCFKSKHLSFGMYLHNVTNIEKYHTLKVDLKKILSKIREISHTLFFSI